MKTVGYGCPPFRWNKLNLSRIRETLWGCRDHVEEYRIEMWMTKRSNSSKKDLWPAGGPSLNDIKTVRNQEETANPWRSENRWGRSERPGTNQSSDVNWAIGGFNPSGLRTSN
jgi:hypothetical protein